MAMIYFPQNGSYGGPFYLMAALKFCLIFSNKKVELREELKSLMTHWPFEFGHALSLGLTLVLLCPCLIK